MNAEYVLGPGSYNRPPSEGRRGQIARIETLSSQLDREPPEVRTEAEAWDAIGDLGDEVRRIREGRADG